MGQPETAQQATMPTPAELGRAAIDNMLLTSQNLTLERLGELEKGMKSMATILKTIVALLEAKTQVPDVPIASYDQMYTPVEDDVDVAPAQPLPPLPPPRGWRKLWQSKEGA